MDNVVIYSNWNFINSNWYKTKKSKQKYKKNYIIAFVCLPLIIIFGSYRFIFNKVSYDVNKVSIIENETKIELPKQVKIATIQFDSYTISYLKITNEESKEKFKYELETNQLWTRQLSSMIKNLLPVNIQNEVGTFDYFVFYNITSDEYNIYPFDGDYECIFIAFDCELQRLIILDDYKIMLN